MNDNYCKRCAHNGACNTGDCIHNPHAKDLFQPINKYYPLELRGYYIYLWNPDGESKYTIALFDYDEKEEAWELRTIGSRIIDDRINPQHLYELVKIGFKIREKVELI